MFKGIVKWFYNYGSYEYFLFDCISMHGSEIVQTFLFL